MRNIRFVSAWEEIRAAKLSRAVQCGSVAVANRDDVAPLLLEVVANSSRRAATAAASVADTYLQISERSQCATLLESKVLEAWQKLRDVQATIEDVARRSIQAEAERARLHECQRQLSRPTETSSKLHNMQWNSSLSRSGFSTTCSSYSCSSHPVSTSSFGLSAGLPLTRVIPSRPASSIGARGRRAYW